MCTSAADGDEVWLFDFRHPIHIIHLYERRLSAGRGATQLTFSIRTKDVQGSVLCDDCAVQVL